MEKVVNPSKCIGCGICAVACPCECIKIELDKKLSYRPSVDHDQCIKCGICTKVCYVNTANRVALAANAARKKGHYGFQTEAFFYHGHTAVYEEYMRAASGGILTTLLKRMLKDGEVDAVIHAKSIPEDGYAPLGVCAVSRTEKEIEEGRGSFYGPIEFSASIQEINSDNSIHSVVVVCTPCVANAIAFLRKHQKKKAEKIRYVFALMCGHNASGRHGLMMIDDFPKSDAPRLLIMREKEEVTHKDSFNISVVFSNGDKKIKSIGSRFKPLWRGFINAESECTNCVDFTGSQADVSFKDAWRIKPVKYSTGESAFIVRNSRINDFLMKMNEEKFIFIKEISRADLVRSQWATIKERYYNALRITNSKEGSLIIKIGYWGCRRLKQIAHLLPGKPAGRIGTKLQLLIASVIGKFLSSYARLTNEKK